MRLPDFLNRLFGRPAGPDPDEELERTDAARFDRNLARLRRQDPDADRIFTTTFTDAYDNESLRGRLVACLQAYATTKHAAKRMDLYYALFDGLDN